MSGAPPVAQRLLPLRSQEVGPWFDSPPWSSRRGCCSVAAPDPPRATASRTEVRWTSSGIATPACRSLGCRGAQERTRRLSGPAPTPGGRPSDSTACAWKRVAGRPKRPYDPAPESVRGRTAVWPLRVALHPRLGRHSGVSRRFTLFPVAMAVADSSGHLLLRV